MSGIIVGVDGSGHSQRALEWAAREAALRQTSLTVLTVQQIIAGWGGATAPVVCPPDSADIERARKLAQADTDDVRASQTARSSLSRPTSVSHPERQEREFAAVGVVTKPRPPRPPVCPRRHNAVYRCHDLPGGITGT